MATQTRFTSLLVSLLLFSNTLGMTIASSGSGDLSRRVDIPNTKPRVLVFAKKREDWTIEQFDDYWLHSHAKTYTDYVSRFRNPTIYEQLHVNQEEKEKLKKAGIPVVDFDGIPAFDAESFEGFNETIEDPDYEKIIAPDEATFSSREGSLEDEAPETEVREYRARMVVVFEKKEGLTDEQFTNAWLNDHATVLKKTPLGKKVIKYDQCHLAEPIKAFAGAGGDSVPKWSGIIAIDAPSFEDFYDSESLKVLSEDAAKWTAPGSLKFMPIDVARIFDRTV
ncbi:hypothetical protein AAF712_003505 [Marasmius tenuissimus]|uniref:EthD domain-containing protein n=1 Tax=Marasmius tenuissimus TaxID=585030 RepID=A0ABR3A7I2_9AGAR